MNAELKVGAREETITVSAAAPVVDTQNVMQQQTLARSTLDAFPTTNDSAGTARFSLAPCRLTPVLQDVGGNAGEGGQLGVHGQRSGDINIYQDGMNLSRRRTRPRPPTPRSHLAVRCSGRLPRSSACDSRVSGRWR